MGEDREAAALDAAALGNIASVLGVAPAEVGDVWPLKQGLTNDSWHFATLEGEYVYRAPGIGTEDLIDREAEVAALIVARDLGLDGTFVHEDAKAGWKVSRFIPNARTLDARDGREVARAMRMARTLHASGAQVGRSFDFFREGKRYEGLLREVSDPHVIPGYDALSAKAARVAAFARADGAPVCLTHNDFFELNILIDGDDRMHLIDWEYAGMSDYAHDFGTFCVCCRLSEDEAASALRAYFGRVPTERERCHNFAYVALAGWCWYVWSLYKAALGGDVIGWREVYLTYAERYLDPVIAGYEALEARVGAGHDAAERGGATRGDAGRGGAACGGAACALEEAIA